MQPGMSEKYAGVYQEFEGNYEEYLERFRDVDLARYVIDQQEQAWIKNYSRGAYVNSGLPGGKALSKKAQEFCTARDWCFEAVEGDLSLLKDLLTGNWDDERFLVLEQGETLVIGGVHDVVAAHGIEAEQVLFGDDYSRYYGYNKRYSEIDREKLELLKPDVDLVIGIDAGGTYTDAAIVSLKDNSVKAEAKSPTTHHDPAVGIRKALEKLPATLVNKAQRLALSTTLATNAIVEEKGARTGLILIGYGPESSALVSIGSRDMKTVVAGRHDIYGDETEPMNEAALLDAARELIQKGVEAFAVSSYLAVRNPDHEIRAKRLLLEKFDIPVAAGHELSDDIDSVRRAHTVLLNARLLPEIGGLIRSIERVVAEMKLDAEIRLVTTDGTLMNTAEAAEQPVRLILSGPAASVKGVRFLTQNDSCVLVDMGGTTSDIAVIEHGSAKRTGRGAVIGHYKTSIQAVDIRTIGLGGDSSIAWEHGKIRVGPDRIIPISRLASQYDHILDNLKKLKGYSASDYSLVQPGTHFLLVRDPENDSYLSEREKRIIELLRNGPLSIVELSEKLVYPYLSILGTDKLEELGIIRKSCLTPSDLMAAEGRLSLWDTSTAVAMIELYSERIELESDQCISLCWKEIHRKISAAIISESLANGDDTGSFPGCNYCESAFSGSASLQVDYKLKYPLVGIGAPAENMLRDVDEYLSCEKQFPEHAGVANAVGAASGSGGIHIDSKIMQNSDGRFALYTPDGVFHFGDLDSAKTEALELSKSCSKSYARRMGYDTFSLEVHIRDRSAPTSFDNELYIDTSVVATMKF